MEETIEIELPMKFKIKFEAFKSEPMTRDYPGDPAYIEIGKISLIGVEGIYLQPDIYGLFNTMMSLYEDEMTEACEDHVQECVAEDAMMQAEHRRDAIEDR